MQVRIPFTKTHLPELEALPEQRWREVLARCADDPSLKALAKRHILLMRLGWAVLPLGLIVYFVLSRTSVDPRILGAVLVGAMVTSIGVIVGSVFFYHRRASRQLRLLIQAAVGTSG